MNDVVNLRRERKRRARDEKVALAEENRKLFGRSKLERESTQHERLRRDRDLDGARLSSPDD